MSAVITREVAPGVTITSAMTPTERQEIVAKAFGLTVAPIPGIPFGPRTADGKQAHIDSTVALFNQRDASVAASKAPPSPKELEAANKVVPPQGDPSPKRTQEFNDEMRAKGAMARTDGRFIAAGEFDREALDLLTARYRSIIRPDMAPDARLRFKAAYENDVRKLYEGKQLTGAQIEKLKGSGNIESFVPAEKGGAKPAAEITVDAALDHATKSSNAEGFANAADIRGPLLHGYRIPQDRAFHVAELTGQLAIARRAKMTQEQVDAAAGWTKA